LRAVVTLRRIPTCNVAAIFASMINIVRRIAKASSSEPMRFSTLNTASIPYW
jgi:hypothetical protein